MLDNIIKNNDANQNENFSTVEQKKESEQLKNKVNNKQLPIYSKSEELINAITHIVGGSFFIIGLILCLINANADITIGGRVSLIVYCLSVLLMFTMSAIYHFLRPNKAKRVFRVFDHCAIFIAIAGTYTPLCFITMSETLWGLIIGIFVWVLAILGVVLNSVNMYNKKVRIFSMISYLGMGWCILVAVIPLIQAWVIDGFLWLLAGGLMYSIGAIFYGVGKSKKYMHCLWHFFVLFGAILQFVAIYFYVVI
ncbi:MAG: hemolysin III family protein [Christensenellales bacterium]